MTTAEVAVAAYVTATSETADTSLHTSSQPSTATLTEQQLLLMMTPIDHQRHQFYDSEWTAPDEDPADEEYLSLLDARREEEERGFVGGSVTAGEGEDLDFIYRHGAANMRAGKTKSSHQQRLTGTTGTTGSNASNSDGETNLHDASDSIMGYSTISTSTTSNDLISPL